MWNAQDFFFIICFVYTYVQISDKLGGVNLFVLYCGELVMGY
jgi:hypothetical protein